MCRAKEPFPPNLYANASNLLGEEQFCRKLRDYVERHLITNLSDDVMSDLFQITREAASDWSVQKGVRTVTGKQDLKWRGHLIATLRRQVDDSLEVLGKYEKRRLPLTSALVTPLRREFLQLQTLLGRAKFQYRIDEELAKGLLKSNFPGDLSLEINEYLRRYVLEVPSQEERNVVIAGCLHAGSLCGQDEPKDLVSAIPMQLSRAGARIDPSEERVVIRRKAVNPKLVYHADWGSDASKRWCAKAICNGDGHYTISAPEKVLNPGLLVAQLRREAGDSGCAFVGFDFPIGIPAYYAERAGVSSFRALLPKLGHGEWRDFYRVCDKPEQISVHRPFYPNGQYKGRLKQDLFHAHGVNSVEPLLRRCERSGGGRKQPCCLFWTLGANQVGKAAIAGWQQVLAPAIKNKEPVYLWPFDGTLQSLLMPGRIIVAETYPAESYGWFSDKRLGSKGDAEARAMFAVSLLQWAETRNVIVKDELRVAMQNGFQRGEDDAFDAVVGLFGMLDLVQGTRPSGEPTEPPVNTIEGWILGRKA
jgi:hypothetical protein